MDTEFIAPPSLGPMQTPVSPKLNDWAPVLQYLSVFR